MSKNKKCQIWIETVIYTLIGLAIIGLMLAVITPRINTMKDKAVIAETINSMNDLNQQIQNTFIAPGNKREVFLSVKKGEYTLDTNNNSIQYLLKGSTLLYSQVNESKKQGEIIILTQERNGKYDIYLRLDYSQFNMTYQGRKINRILTAAPTPYHLLIEYIGGTDNRINIEAL